MSSTTPFQGSLFANDFLRAADQFGGLLQIETLASDFERHEDPDITSCQELVDQPLAFGNRNLPVDNPRFRASVVHMTKPGGIQ